MGPHLPFVRKPRLELLARVLGVLDVNELLVDWRRVVESGLPAAVHACHRRPDADGASEVIGHVHRHHVLHAQAEVCRTLDLKRRVRKWNTLKEKKKKSKFSITVEPGRKKKLSDLHGFDDRVAHLMAVVAHTIHRHVHCQLPCHRLPKGVPARHREGSRVERKFLPVFSM